MKFSCIKNIKMNPELLKILLAKIKIPHFENKMLNLLLANIKNSTYTLLVIMSKLNLAKHSTYTISKHYKCWKLILMPNLNLPQKCYLYEGHIFSYENLLKKRVK